MKIHKKIVCSVMAIIGLVTGGSALYSDDKTHPVGQVMIDDQTLGELRISQKGLEINGNAEGCRRDPYTCPSGLATNGVGNTHHVPDKPVSLEQVATDWVHNLQIAERCVSHVEKHADKVMTQGQFDALTSFVFNTGCERFKHNRDQTPTQIYRLSKAGRYTQACQQLKRWVYGGSKKQPGLITRREREYERCMEVD